MTAVPARVPPSTHIAPRGRLAVVDTSQPLERAYREEATQIRAALAARTGDVGLAEDAVQDAFVEAIEHWPRRAARAFPRLSYRGAAGQVPCAGP